MPLCRHSELSSLWLSQGMLAVGERPLTIQQPFASFDDYWHPFLGGQGPAGAYVAEPARGEARRAAESTAPTVAPPSTTAGRSR